MERQEYYLKLYGVITEIFPDGTISVCEPIFTDYWIPEKKFYRLLTEDFNHPSFPGTRLTFYQGIEEVDISVYGQPLFLPASRKKIGDKNKYLIVYQPKKNSTVSKTYGYTHEQATHMFGLNESHFVRRNYTPVILTTGIKFPLNFITVSSSHQLSADELKSYTK